MARVRKREGPQGVRWQARWTAPDGREIARTFRRRRDADAWLSEQDVAAVRGEWVDPRKGAMPFRDWVLRWVATDTTNRETTRARDWSVIRTHLLPHFDQTPLVDIDHMTVRRFVANLDRAPATVHKVFQVLDKVMQTAVDARLIVSNPCDRVQLPTIEEDERRFLTAEELHTLAEAAGRWRPAVLLMGYAGLRIGEVAGLRRSNVDVLRGAVRVVETAVEVQGRLSYNAPKTKAGRRTVPVSRLVADELAGHLNSHPYELVFAGRDGGGMRPNQWRRRVFTPAVQQAGLEPLTPHQLRHTAIALWISAGVDPKRVAAWAGHASVRTVLDRYGHLYEVDDGVFIDRLDAIGRLADEDALVRHLSVRDDAK